MTCANGLASMGMGVGVTGSGHRSARRRTRRRHVATERTKPRLQHSLTGGSGNGAHCCRVLVLEDLVRTRALRRGGGHPKRLGPAGVLDAQLHMLRRRLPHACTAAPRPSRVAPLARAPTRGPSPVLHAAASSRRSACELKARPARFERGGESRRKARAGRRPRPVPLKVGPT